MRTADLAHRLLPAELATQMLSHEVGEPIFAGGPLRNIVFFARPAPLGPDLCHRRVIHVELEPVGGLHAESSRQDAPVRFKGTYQKIQIVAAAKCQLKEGGFFGWVQPETAFDGAAQAVRRLLSVRDEAQAGVPLSVSVSCASETRENVCNRNAHALLAGLPLHKIYLIEPRGTGWRFAVMPSGPGRLFWDVILTGPEGPGQSISLAWRVPPPF